MCDAPAHISRATPANSIAGRRGFTAFEALLAAAILAVVTTAVSGALMAGRQQAKLAKQTVYSSLLARSLMDEILRLPYSDPTHSSPNSRANFICVSNYNGYTDGAGTSIPTITDITGYTFPSYYQNFTRSVTVAAASYQPTGWTVTDTGLTITVTVSFGNETLATQQRFVSPY